MEFPDNVEIGTRLQQALAAHDQGQFAQAQAGYEEILRTEPKHFEALHLLGIIACQTRNTQRGIELFTRALSVNPDHAAVHCNLGNAYKALRRLTDAVTSYDRAIELKPDFAEAYFNRGNALADLRRLDEALASYDRAIELKPDFAECCSNRGNVLSGLGRLDEAQASYGRAIVLKPDFARAYVNLGSAAMVLGQFDRAYTSFMQALRIDPNLLEGLNSFSALLRHMEIPAATGEARKSIIRCFESSAIGSEAVRRASTATLLGDLKNFIRSDAGVLPSVAVLDSLTGGLLFAHLMNCPIANLRLEGLLARARAQLLMFREHDDTTKSQQDSDLRFVIALAHQGFLNEFVWRVSGEEKRRIVELEESIIEAIRKRKAPAVRDLFLLATYRPLHAVEEIRSWCMTFLNEFQGQARAALAYLVVNPVREAELAADIEQITSIDDPVSVAVRLQYEENPYPRWDSLSVGKPMHYTTYILKEIAPHRPELRATSEMPKVLIAGCGSGKHPISSALILDDAEVMAIDLSRASLAYARRKAIEFGVANIRFAQADILRLPALGGQYDVIECVGVLHHMADPKAGLNALLCVLKPGGFINLGLYSELARQHIVRLRKLIANRELSPGREGIRLLREALIETDTADSREIQKSGDFYSTSTVRDLLLHVHEHRFSILQVRDFIEGCKLEFLGFQLMNPQVKLQYAKRFHDDPACVSLGNWHQFEMENPRTFQDMYQFWCRKPASMP